MSIASDVPSAARDYATKFGWHVVPLKGRDKRPLIPRWQQEASADLTKINQWFDKWPQANLGLCLGPKSGVIDVEVDDEEGQRTAAELLEECRTPTWDSSRGPHRLFQFDHRFAAGLKAVEKTRGLEIRIGGSGKGAQTMLPPSTHPSGLKLSWRPGLSPLDVDPIPLPEAVRQLLGTPVDDMTLTCGTDNDLAKAPGVAEGSRNETLFRLVGIYLARFGADAQLMSLAADFAARCTPPLPESEVFRIVQGIVQRHNASQTNGAVVGRTRPKSLTYQPFPTKALPTVLNRFVTTTADVLSCDEAYLPCQCLGLSPQR